MQNTSVENTCPVCGEDARVHVSRDSALPQGPFHTVTVECDCATVELDGSTHRPDAICETIEAAVNQWAIARTGTALERLAELAEQRGWSELRNSALALRSEECR